LDAGAARAVSGQPSSPQKGPWESTGFCTWRTSRPEVSSAASTRQWQAHTNRIELAHIAGIGPTMFMGERDFNKEKSMARLLRPKT
jgi:hypothetical protein